MLTDDVAENALLVLGLSSGASGIDVERAGRRLLDELAVGMSAAKHYEAPAGREERSEEKIRRAMAELHDPVARFRHEMLLASSPGSVPITEVDVDGPTAAGDAARRLWALLPALLGHVRAGEAARGRGTRDA